MVVPGSDRAFEPPHLAVEFSSHSRANPAALPQVGFWLRKRYATPNELQVLWRSCGLYGDQRAAEDARPATDIEDVLSILHLGEAFTAASM